MKKDFLAFAAVFFASYPAETAIFFTTDEQAFFFENDATNHAKSLRESPSDEPVVIAVTRDEAEAYEEQELAALKAAEEKAAADAKAQADADKKAADAKAKADAEAQKKAAADAKKN